MINQFQNFAAKIFNLRRHSDSRIRIAWHGGAFAALVLVLLLPTLRHFVVALWIIANLILYLAAFFWGLAHFRAVRPASPPALRWAFVGALFGALWVFANFESWLMQHIDRGMTMPSAVVTFSALISAPFLLLGAYAQGMLSGAVAAFYLRRRPPAEAERAVALTVSVSWIEAVAFFFINLLFANKTLPFVATADSAFSSVLRDLLNALEWGGALPVLWITLYWMNVTARPHPYPARLMRRISARFVLVFRWRGKARVRDLRGAALGLLASLLTLALGPTEILAPLQAVTLNSLLHLQGALRETDRRQNTVKGPVTIQADFSDQETARNALADRIVRLTIDAQTRRQALSSRSECSLQNDMVRLLKSYGALRVVLPAPALDADHPPKDDRPLRPQPTNRDIQRSEKDLRPLMQTMREAANVLVAQPNIGKRHTTADERRVEYAALGAFPLTLPTYSAPRLPLIPADWKKDAPASLRLFAAAKGQDALQIRRVNSRSLDVAGEMFPLALNHAIMPDFESAEAGNRIPHFDYTEVFSGQLLCLRSGAPDGNADSRWTQPSAFFRGKIVFLDSLTMDEQETSIGKISSIEAQARAAYALFTQSLVSRPAPFWPVLALLALGAFAGYSGFRRDPLDAGWRMALPLLGLILIYIGFVCFSRCWLDPVAPAVAVFFAFLLVTQATYAVEQDEGGRARVLLERFVAPQLLEELLADPRSLGLGGKMQQVCVLFADVRNFTGFTENRDPQEVIGVINEYMTALTDAMYLHGGIFDKYTGDGLMAFFRITDNAPEAPQIQQAVTAAQAMQEAALAISAQRTAAGQPPLSIGIGLHYGEAVVGMVGSPSLANYTALGHTVVISARLQSIAAGGEIVLSETVYQQTVGLRAVAGELVQVKGISAPVRPYRLRALSEAPLVPQQIPFVPPLPESL